MDRYMFDTNCFYQINKKYLDTLNNLDAEFLITILQKKELEDTLKRKRFTEDHKQRILNNFTLIDNKMVPLESAILGSSFILGYVKLGTAGYYARFKKELDQIKEDSANINDALIAEAAICNKCIFVTHEKKLIKVIRQHYPDNIMSFNEFKVKVGLE